MIQFPTYYLNDLVKSGISFSNIISAIFLAGLSDEEVAEIETITFVMEADLDKFLDPNQEYEITDASSLGGM